MHNSCKICFYTIILLCVNKEYYITKYGAFKPSRLSAIHWHFTIHKMIDVS